MWDREFHFADDRIVEMLKKSFVPVAIDEWYHRRRKDDEGEFYRKVVYQRDGLKPDRTTQGFYIFKPDGTLLRAWNNRDVAKMRRYLEEALKGYATAEPAKTGDAADPRYERALPDGAIVVDVFTRIVKADWPEPKNEWEKTFRGTLGRDHLWIRKDEVASLSEGRMPESLIRRMARFHLVDNTRGEPPLWKPEEVRESTLAIDKGRLDGRVRVSTAANDRGFDAALFGTMEARAGRIARFDLVARGQFWGEGTYTQGAPPGKFTLAIAFTLADEGEASKVPPQGARELREYLR